MPQDVTDPMEFDSEAPLLLNVTHRGDDHFSVKLSNLSGGRDDQLVNTIGNFEGKVMTSVNPGKYVFEVNYGREYSIEPTDFDTIETAPLSVDRTDPYVVPIRMSSPIKIDLSTKSKEHVGVSLLNGFGQLVDNIVNEIGPAKTSALVRQEGEGFLFFDIEGPWTAEISEV